MARLWFTWSTMEATLNIASRFQSSVLPFLILFQLILKESPWKPSPRGFLVHSPRLSPDSIVFPLAEVRLSWAKVRPFLVPTSLRFYQEEKMWKVVEICQNMVPDHCEKVPEKVNSIHRIGQRFESSSEPPPRAIILHFTIRHFRDIIWKATKQNSISKKIYLLRTERETQPAVASVGEST